MTLLWERSNEMTNCNKFYDDSNWKKKYQTHARTNKNHMCTHVVSKKFLFSSNTVNNKLKKINCFFTYKTFFFYITFAEIKMNSPFVIVSVAWLMFVCPVVPFFLRPPELLPVPQFSLQGFPKTTHIITADKINNDYP